MSIAEGNLVSKMTFGGYDLAKYSAGGSKIYWHNLVTPSKYWTLRMTAVNIGTQAFPTSVSNLIIDSGTSYLLLPTADFLAFSLLFT